MAASIVVAAPVILFLEQGLWYLPFGIGLSTAHILQFVEQRLS